MLEILYFIALIWITWELLALGIEMAWEFAKILCTVLLFPLLLIGLVCVGLIYIAIPILIVIGVITFVWRLLKA